MNILPKKSWHVRSWRNIERVRKDEAKAAEEEKERQRKIALAESEARTDILRQKARKRRHSEDRDIGTSKDAVVVQRRHVNFFEELEEGKKQDGKGNKEYEEEKRQEKEKQEKAIGLLTYLGQSAVESQTHKPWYFNRPEKQSEDSWNKSSRDKAKEEFDAKTKRSLDPLLTMSKYIEATNKVHKHREHGDSHRQKPERKKHKRHGKEEELGSAPRPKTVEQLRAERLRREKEERERTEKLLAKLRGEIPREEEGPTDEREMRYNSQFNPDLVRKKKRRDYDQY